MRVRFSLPAPMKSKVLVIVGPTASGKSDLAVHLAKKFKGEIISADSRQVYNGLNIGTGKITKKKMQGIPHHLLDVADPKKQFSASQYKDLGSRVLEKIINKNKLPIVVGGTGFYIDILSCSINFPDVAPNQKLRKELAKKDIEELLKLLKGKDPIRAKEVDQNNKVRIIRAIEIAEVLGSVPKLKPSDSPHEFIYVGLLPEKVDLDKRIYERLIKRLPGIILEVKNLQKNGMSWKRMHELGLEYRYVSQYVQRKLSKDEMIEKLYREIRHYAKRQMTWFKRNKSIKWFEPSEYKEIEKYATIALNSGD